MIKFGLKVTDQLTATILAADLIGAKLDYAVEAKDDGVTFLIAVEHTAALQRFVIEARREADGLRAGTKLEDESEDE